MTPSVRSQPARGWFVTLFLSIAGAVFLPGSVAPCAAAQPPPAAQAPPNDTPEPPAAEPTPAAGNKTYEAPRPVDNTQFKIDSQIKQILRNGRFAPGEEEIFNTFVRTYLLPRWTQPQSVTKKSLVVLRGELAKQYLWQGTGAPHDSLNADVLKFMTFVASRDYPEPLRVNAILMIGELNEAEPTPTTPPHPLPAAVPAMVAAIGAPQQIDAVKVAAMVGILRHLKLNGISTPEARGPVRDAALQIIKTAEPPPGRSPAAYTWMRAQAADILGELRDAGSGGSIAAALAAVVADSRSSTTDKACFDARCAAARALGKLGYQAGAGLNPSQTATALGQLALDACAAEDGQALSRYRLKDRVSAAMTGLTGADDQHKGIEPLMTDAASQQLLGELRPTLQAVLDTLDDKKLSIDEVVEKLTEPRMKLQKLLRKET